ncbi:Uncharacterized protein HZ326_11431 [Fusarium oxysporum f. sp. albedinis]|nr:Uncharacterized protein HZ326_11431 [Fusarium oxysporum f. sp. albedinis]
MAFQVGIEAVLKVFGSNPASTQPEDFLVAWGMLGCYKEVPSAISHQPSPEWLPCSHICLPQTLVMQPST